MNQTAFKTSDTMLDVKHVNSIKRAELDEKIENGAGFFLAQMESQDLERLRRLIQEQYLHVLQMHSPNEVSRFYAKSMRHYHEIYPECDFSHGEIWLKKARVLGPSAVETITNMAFLKQLKVLLGEFLIADEERFGWPGIYWRLVRPGSSDVGPIHADKWFWDLGHGDMPKGYQRLKIWISIFTVPGRSGLRVVPRSHQKQDWKYHGEQKGNMVKPVLDELEEDLDILNLTMDAGQFVLFHDRLLHGGMPNSSTESRVSLEFTLLIPE